MQIIVVFSMCWWRESVSLFLTTSGEPQPRPPDLPGEAPRETPLPRRNGPHYYGNGNARSARQPQQQFGLKILCTYLFASQSVLRRSFVETWELVQYHHHHQHTPSQPVGGRLQGAQWAQYLTEVLEPVHCAGGYWDASLLTELIHAVTTV